MSLPYMPLYIADYIADTRRLTTLEHGAYMLLIMEYWRNGGLPDDDRKLARITGLRDDEWLAIRDDIAELFLPGWRHKRIDAELAKATEKSDKAKQASAKRWDSKRNADAMQTDMRTHDHSVMQSEPEPEKNTHTSERAREADFRQAIATEYKRQGHIPPDTGRAITWLGHGWNPEICVAAVADGLRKKNKFLPLSYFDGAIADAHAKPPAGQARAGPAPKPSNPYAARLAQLAGIGQPNEPSFPGTTIDAEPFGHTARPAVARG